MGRGDKKTKKGKRSKGSFGVSRNRAEIKARLKRSTTKKSEAADAAAKPRRVVKKKTDA
jgi:ribosomal small subunit protein bTHX